MKPIYWLKTKLNPISLLFVAILSGIFSWHFRFAGTFDPDRYFHFALSRWIAEHHGKIPHALAGPVGLGWDKFFPDKEFLFHVFTGLAFKLGHETGVQILIAIIFCVFNGVIFSILKKLWSTPIALLTFFVLIPTQTHIILRMNFLRPHTLAITLFFTLIYFLIRDSKPHKGLIALVCFIFALSYHGFYLLFPILGLYFLINRKADFTRAWQIPFYGLLGLVAGIILNPHFPGNITMSIRHLMIALFETQSGTLSFGSELIPWRSDVLLRQALWAVLGLGVSRIFYDQQKVIEKNWRFEFVWYLAGFFWLLTLLNPRAQEMAIPLSFLAMGQIFSNRSNLKTRIAVVVAILGVAVPSFLEAAKSPAPDDQFLQKYINFMKHRPEENLRIFNTDWDMSPYILYAKPSFSFIDLLDPSFLFVRNRDLHDTRQKLYDGFGIDPYGLLKATFNADWIEAKSPILIRQLEHEPDFIRIFPEKYTNSDINGTYPFIFSLNKKRTTHFFYKYQYINKTFEKDWTTHSYLKWKPTPKDTSDSLDLQTMGDKELPPSFFDVLKVLKEKTKRENFEPGIHCTYVRPEITKTDELLHATILGVGGGRVIRVWYDQEPIFISDQAYESTRLIQNFLVLKKPVTIHSTIEAIVCSSDESNYMGISLSLWTPEEIEKKCSEKGASKLTYLPSPIKFPQTNILTSSCFAPFTSVRTP